MSLAHRIGDPRKTRTSLAGRTALALILVDHFDASATPAQHRSALDQRVLPLLGLDVLMDLLRESRTRSLQVPGRLERSFAGHQRVLRAIKRRDAAGAENAVRQHLQEIEEVVMRKL